MQDILKIEEEMLTFWEKKKILQKVEEKNKAGELFYFCDGPPYATGELHPGTAWNKSLKDMVCRYQRARGKNVRAQAGYDTHGLPIEVKVEKELGIKSKNEIEERGIEEFIEKCKEFATKYIDVMGRQFKRTGVWMNFEAPYLTFKNNFIESTWSTIKQANEKGLLSRGVYVLPYCSRCSTTLANYELEYGEQKDPSIFVKMKSVDEDNTYYVIWTTTPWTLMSNMAIMVHPTFTYIKIKVGTEIWVVAKETLDRVMKDIDESPVIIEELSGKKLEGKKYIHPLQDKVEHEADRKIILSDEFVTLEEGSGLVHCAPGHGPEDFIIGKRFGVEIYSPVNEKGEFTKGAYKGKEVRSTNKSIIQDLKESGALIHEEEIMHRYPHCWRCKTPLIFMTTDQWFINISEVREKMLEEIDKVDWHPKFARTRFKDFVSNAPDWCISRQRFWGIPLPIWVCEKCGNTRVIGSVDELPKKIKDLHRPYIDKITFKCECGNKMKRVEDVLDVWVDSGNVIWASLTKEEKEKYKKTHFIVEGKDQTRGWFYSLLGSGIIKWNEAPYEKVMMHGWFVGENGEKMSKSVGNFTPFDEMISKYGADTFRLWGLSCTIWDDIKFSWIELKDAFSTLNIIYNVGTFLQRFEASKNINISNLQIEDRWIISRLNSVIKETTELMETYELHSATRILRTFIIEDISRFYMKLVKKRMSEDMYSDEALNVLYNVYFETLKMLNIIAPFSSEYLYQTIYKKDKKEESISFFDWPLYNITDIDQLLENGMEISNEIISASINARQKAQIKLRWPLEKIVFKTNSTEATNTIEKLSRVIEWMTNVKQIELNTKVESQYSIKINEGKVKKFYRESGLDEKVIQTLKNESPEKLQETLGNKKVYKAEGFEILPEVIEITEKAKDYEVTLIEKGKVYLYTKINPELFEEAMLREVARRIQQLRKQENLVETDQITISFEASKTLAEIINKHNEEIIKQTNAAKIKETKLPKIEEINIEDEKLKIEIKKV
ncbi:isoleucine--tRNA ligase [Candidatus Micrarchaeota archaeon]|nr:isoleucine--tRNA ligase [Candidatus Micrarchaeota archaeon]